MSKKRQKIGNVFHAIFIILIVCFINCEEDKGFEAIKDLFEDHNSNLKITEITSKKSMFISQDYTFKNDGINIVTGIKFNPFSNEFIAIDGGNNCVYVFNENGKYKRKFGYPGQGPGALLDPTFIDIDSEGNIFVYESINHRISIFNFKGEFQNSFRVESNERTRFSVTDDHEILVNQPKNGCYITAYSYDGDIQNNIGKIDSLNKRLNVNTMYSEGYPFKDVEGNYRIILAYHPIEKIYNKSGAFIQERSLIEKLNIKKTIKIDKLENMMTLTNYIDFYYENDRYYFFKYDTGDNPMMDGKLSAIIFDNNNDISTKINIPYNGNLLSTFRGTLQFEVINNNIFVPISKKAEILKYKFGNISTNN